MIVPRNRSEFLAFCNAHTDLWAAKASSLGLEIVAVNEWKALVTTANERVTEQMIAADAAKAATNTANDAIDAARVATSNLVRAIRDYAITTNDLGVWDTAGLPRPADPSAVPPPGQPTMVRASLNLNGSLTLRWQRNNAPGSTGTSYLIFRKLPSQTSFNIIGGGTNKSFTDALVPSGIANVQYIIQGIRGSTNGAPSETLIVNFGVASGGGGGAVIVSTAHASSEGERLVA